MESLKALLINQNQTNGANTFVNQGGGEVFNRAQGSQSPNFH